MKKVLKLQKIKAGRSGKPKPMSYSHYYSKRHGASTLGTIACRME